MLQGPENGALEAKIKQYYTESSQDEDSGVKGFVRIYYFNIFIWKFWKLYKPCSFFVAFVCA